MRFGVIPIVRATGGLKDTIINNYTGFLYEKATLHSLEDCLNLTVDIYKNRPEIIH